MTVILALAAILVYGLAFMLGWNWFVVPLGTPAIVLWQALGISMLIGLPMMTMKRNDKLQDQTVSSIFQLVVSVIVIGLMAGVHLLWKGTL